jgi:hypothetical protein
VGERRKKVVAARGVDANFPICKGERELLFIEENLGLGFQMGQMGCVGLAQTLNRAAIIYFHFISWRFH